MGTTDDGRCYLVSKFVAGCDLSVLLKNSKPDPSDAARLLIKVAEVLHHAHQRGLVRRDIKPANILIDKEGRPVVTDFGLALRIDDVGRGPVLAGSPPYMSPEQARHEGHLVDARPDVCSLGVVFYELLTGQRPFHSLAERSL